MYAWDLRGAPSLEGIARQVWDDLGVPPPERALASRLIRTINEVGPELDRALADVTANWRLERLSAVDRAVLRLAAAELHERLTPPRVVIQEAVHLAERFGTAESARFVNGVIDALARRMGVL
jgi:N utilization substance protein B